MDENDPRLDEVSVNKERQKFIGNEDSRLFFQLRRDLSIRWSILDVHVTSIGDNGGAS